MTLCFYTGFPVGAKAPKYGKENLKTNRKRYIVL